MVTQYVSKCPLPRPAFLLEGKTVLDIGPCLQPMGWYKADVHVCVEPYAPYADKLLAAGYEVVRLTAKDALSVLPPGVFDCVYMMDVIEHMERAEGEEILEMIKAIRPKQVVISTPNGFHAQHTDEWDMGGEHWQTHRSGWVPEDFPGWGISQYNTGSRIGFTAVSP